MANQGNNWKQQNQIWGKPGAALGAIALVFALVHLVAAAQAAQAQTFAVLHSFKGGDGSDPEGSLWRDSADNLYGTTVYGGSFGFGTVFKLDTSGNETLLYSFSGKQDGAYPWASVIQDAEGNLYSTTSGGGRGGNGTVFRLDTANKETVLHDFSGRGGASPRASLLLDSRGNLYSTTLGGGAYGAGVVFKLSPKSRETVPHSFAEPPDGAYPLSGLVADANNNLYGTTVVGGKFGAGTVFKLDRAGKEKVLYSFRGGTDGGYPWANLVLDQSGNVYGTASEGGDLTCDAGSGCGVVFKMDSSGKEEVLYSFAGGTDGAYPYTGLTMDANGNLYGVTVLGGTSGAGTVFRVDTGRNETVLHNFTGGTDGGYPISGLIQDVAGNLYGTAQTGGQYGYGNVFELTP